MIRELRRNPLASFGLAVVLFGLLMAVAGPSLAPQDPRTQSLRARLQPPSVDHVLGTDHLGRDIFSRVLWGARVSVPLGLTAVAVAMGMGLAVGLVAGYRRGRVDDVLMRLVDVLLCFPTMLLAIAVVAVLGGGTAQLTLAIGLAQFPKFARLARAGAMQVTEMDYVVSARALGKGDLGIVLRHVLPNMLSSVVVLATLTIGTAIIIESSLSFLGLGGDPTLPTWGGMTSQGLPYLRDAPWVSGFPSILVLLTVLGYNLLGDTLRDVLDPRLRD